MSPSIRYTIEAVNRTREEFQEVENGIERLRKARVAATRVVLEEQRAQQFLKQAYRAQHQQFMDNITVMRNVGTIGRGLLSMWQAFTIGQFQVSESLSNVREAQIAVNTALELYGENSVVYMDAKDHLEDMERAAKKAETNMLLGFTAIGLSAVGVVADIGTLLVQLELIAEVVALGGYIIPVAVVVTGLVAALQAIEYLKTTAQVAAGEVAPGGTAADFPAGYIPGEYLDVTEPISFDPTAPGWQGGVMRPQGANVTFTQINYGVEGGAESFERFRDMIDDIFNLDDE